MKPFSKLHLWLILPFLVTLIGFQGYWMGFRDAPFHWHLHGLSATFWYICLIIQPWLYHNRPISVHRKVGMFSLIIAGFVIASALNMIIVSLPTMSELSPLYSVRYSLALVDCISITGFALSVVLAITYARNTQVHARWMISTVFWVLSPGTVRFSFIPLGAIFQPKAFSDFPFIWTDVFIWNEVLICLIILYLIIRDIVKQKTVYFSYVLILIVNLLFIPIINGLKDAPWLRSFFE
ncbi:hypothetical protein [Algoriphagus antarcticus]|uniref:Uncharacterized protein n=1 Tax=Algoriphagus antarcticus TaxID=238540 RepID=A0A3E0DU22_9BACT|nr:hypothetical protein [Algoriphagus antarcticus]REG86408.1 hypothetical protein C8N25_112112 [Algoriphagus antarcticus]